jgi:hypothetical protein
MTEKTCNSCIHFGACSKWTDFPKQCGVPVCASFAQQSEWISVEDRLPEDTGTYLTWHNAGYYGQHEYNAKLHGWNVISHDDRSTEIKTVTHWMPLPEPPKMKGGAE